MRSYEHKSTADSILIAYICILLMEMIHNRNIREIFVDETEKRDRT